MQGTNNHYSIATFESLLNLLMIPLIQLKKQASQYQYEWKQIIQLAVLKGKSVMGGDVMNGLKIMHLLF
jgi:hypothetical protein